MSKCPECGCPHILSDKHHYKDCPTWTDSYRVKHIEINFKELLQKQAEVEQKNIEYYKSKLAEVIDCIKDCCLDEVYLTRWDCQPLQGEPAN